MTKRELVEALKDLPDDAVVFYHDNEDGPVEVTEARLDDKKLKEVKHPTVPKYSPWWVDENYTTLPRDAEIVRIVECIFLE
jgi:hypothetical protein